MGLVILIQVTMLFYYGRDQIQRGRTNPSQQMTLVSLIVAAICGLVEVLQGLQTLSACLHHADVNEQVRVNFYQHLMSIQTAKRVRKAAWTWNAPS